MSPDRKLIFPFWILSEFLTAWECDECGQSGKRVWLKFPLISRPRWDVVILRYPVKCPCGAHGCVTVSLPLLLFCYIVGRLDLPKLQRGRRKAEMQVLPGESRQLLDYLREFEMEVIDLAPGIAELIPPKSDKPPAPPKPVRPAAHERFNFKLTEAEWQEFLRRLGFGDNDGGDDRPKAGE